MDIATIIGLLLGFGLILTSIAMGGGGLGPFIDPPSMMIVFGGATAASLINFPLKRNLGAFAVVLKCFLFKLPTPQETIAQFKKFAEVVRKDGLLALEEEASAIKDDFMKRGLESLISGVPAEDVAATLETELAYIEQRHVGGKKIIDSCGAAAPAFGMIGTLIGLVQMLRSLDDPSKIGGGMATALLTTLYGALVANVICIPLAGKLEARNGEESMIRELMIRGISLLGEGESPRVVEEKLLSFIAPKTRKSITASKSIMPNDTADEPAEDIPAWFMTYSDVITLLMTFFILLLTFATTEPERFEKVTTSVFGSTGATGVAGHKQDKLDRDSWSQRIRPRAARIAMQGSEMPPIHRELSKAAVGKGLEAVTNEEAKQDVMKTYAFEVPITKLVNRNVRVTREGERVAEKLSAQLRSLSIHCVFEISERQYDQHVCAFAHHLYQVEQARPGQIAIAVADDVESGMVRIVIERYESNR